MCVVFETVQFNATATMDDDDCDCGLMMKMMDFSDASSTDTYLKLAANTLNMQAPCNAK